MLYCYIFSVIRTNNPDRSGKSGIQMRKRLKNLKNKSGHSDNGSPRQLIDEAVYRNRSAAAAGRRPRDSTYSGWSWATRPRDSAISISRPFS